MLRKKYSYESAFCLQQFLKELISECGLYLVYGMGALLVIKGELSFSSLLTFGTLLSYFFEPVQSIVNLEKDIRELKKSIDDTKMYVILNKKDKVKEISKFFLNDLGIEEEEAIGKNIFDVIENKYRLIRLNDSGCLKADMKKFYHKYWKRANPESPVNSLELGIQLDDGSEDALYFSQMQRPGTSTKQVFPHSEPGLV